MDRVIMWLSLPLVVFLLRQSNGASAECSESQNKISRLGNELLNVTQMKHKYKTFLDTCYERLEKETIRSGSLMHSRELLEYQFKNQLEQSDVVNQNLKKELEAKAAILKSKEHDIKLLQTVKDYLEKKVESLEHKVAQLENETRNNSKPVRVYNSNSVKENELLSAAKSGDVSKATSLVEDGTNVNVRDNSVHHLTSLMTASMYGNVEVARVLLEGGANLEDTSSTSGNTALHHGASAGRLKICRLLLDKGAKVDPLDNSKNTPLHLAAVNGHLPVVKLLVTKGADVYRKNNASDTPRDKAWGNGKKNVARWLDCIAEM